MSDIPTSTNELLQFVQGHAIAGLSGSVSGPSLHGLTCVHHTDAERLAITCPVCLTATLAEKDRLLERMAGALRRAKGHVATNDRSRKNTRKEVLAQIRDALAEYADTIPKVLDPAPAPQ